MLTDKLDVLIATIVVTTLCLVVLIDQPQGVGGIPLPTPVSKLCGDRVFPSSMEGVCPMLALSHTCC